MRSCTIQSSCMRCKMHLAEDFWKSITLSASARRWVPASNLAQERRKEQKLGWKRLFHLCSDVVSLSQTQVYLYPTSILAHNLRLYSILELWNTHAVTYFTRAHPWDTAWKRPKPRLVVCELSERTCPWLLNFTQNGSDLTCGFGVRWAR